jgi:hypothetical protein
VKRRLPERSVKAGTLSCSRLRHEHARRRQVVDESSILRDVVVLRRPYCLRDLLERGLQDHTNRGFARHFAGLVGDYAPVGRE